MYQNQLNIFELQIQEYLVSDILVLQLKADDKLHKYSINSQCKIPKAIPQAYFHEYERTHNVKIRCHDFAASDLLHNKNGIPVLEGTKPEIIIANNFLKLVICPSFIGLMNKIRPKYISVVINFMDGEGFTPTSQEYNNRYLISTDSMKYKLAVCMREISYRLIYQKEYLTESAEVYARMDFIDEIVI